MIPDKQTPRQFALGIIINEMNSIYRRVERTHSIDGTDLSPTEARGVMRTLAKEHNRVLDESGMEGLHLEVPA
jgi:hypothetical protein